MVFSSHDSLFKTTLRGTRALSLAPTGLRTAHGRQGPVHDRRKADQQHLRVPSSSSLARLFTDLHAFL